MITVQTTRLDRDTGMKPPFALTLSFKGLQLLHRSAGGWRRVGAVTLDVADLDAAMSDLRQKAEMLEPGRVSCKILLPNDQIRYMTFDTGEVSDAVRKDLIRGILDGATPYPLDDLTYDISPNGSRTHVAAVARETLAEAETFAIEHGLNPVAFAAIPGEMPFLGEPFFGPTRHAATVLHAGERVDPDGVAVVIIGDVDLADPTRDDPGSDADTADKPPRVAEVYPDLDLADRPKSERTGFAEPSPPPLQDTPAESVFRSRVLQADTTTPSEAPLPPAPAPEPTIRFASRRRGTSTVAGDPEDPAKPWVLRATKPQSAPDSTPKSDVAKPTATPMAPPEPELAASLKQVKAPAPPVEEPSERGGFLSRRKPAKRQEPPVPKQSVPTSDPIAPARLRAVAAARAAPLAPPTERDPASLVESPEDEAQRMTIFGAREKAQRRGKPRHLGLILTTLLLFFLAGVAVWAALFVEGEFPAVRVTEETSDMVLDLAPSKAVTADEIIAEPVPDLPVPETASDPETRLAFLPEATEAAPGLTDSDAAVLDALRPDPNPAESNIDPAQVEDDTARAADPDAIAPAEVVVPNETDIETRYAVTGIWPLAPDAPSDPAPAGLEHLFVTSLDPDIETPDAVALPQTSRIDTDTMLAVVESPADPGTVFDLGADGLVVPTPVGALSPDGHMVYLGRPPLAPPPAPVRFETAPETDEVLERLSVQRPTTRPGDLTEQSERAQLGGQTRTELATKRPLARPPAPKEKLEVDTTPTVQAVAQSRIPTIRPKDLAKRAEEAKKTAEPVQTRAATVKPKTVTPRVPSSASVARQATVENALNLNRVNLIGVYGTPSNRRALVRLPSGRYKKVKVGDQVDGGRVLAIGDSKLQYRKGTRTRTLTMPRS